MAWPCISRVCCLARFWNQFDKSDLSVPLTIQNYSDISEQEVRSVTKHVSTSGNHLSSPEPGTTGSPRDGTGTHRPFRARREPSYKPREDYRPPGVPFPSVTQYKQDYKAWPIPRKENFPWIINGGSRAEGTSDSPVRSAQVRAPERQEPGRALRWGEPPGLEDSKTSSYRQEYRPWTGARPARSVRKPPPAQDSSPGTEASNVSRETSYQAAFSGEAGRSSGLHQGNHLIPPAASSTQPTPVTQPIPNIRSSNPCSLRQSILPASWDSRAEEHLVRTKLPPNSSAVFQSGPRVFNI